MRFILCLVALALFVSPVVADTVVLATGEKLDGVVRLVVLRQGESERVIWRGEFAGVELRVEEPDRVQLDAERQLVGRVDLARVQYSERFAAYTRAELRSVVVLPARLTDLEKEFLAKKAEVKENDAGGLYDLALWCRDKGLVFEAAEMARQCLKANPTPEVDVLAHRLAGHVLQDGQWVEPGPEKSPEEEPGTTPSRPAEETTRAVDPALAALARKLAEEHEKKAEEAKVADWEAIKKAHQKEWEAAAEKIKKAESDVESARKQKDDRADELRDERRRSGGPDRDRLRDISDDYEKAKKALDKAEDAVNTAKREQAALAQKIKTEQTQVNSRAVARKEKLTVARSKIERLLLLGRKLNEAEMRQMFEEALRSVGG